MNTGTGAENASKAPLEIRRTLLERKICLIALATVSLSMLAYIAVNAHRPFRQDEAYYLQTVALIEVYGLSTEFLRQLPGPAGPLYSVVHYLAAPITNLSVPLVRFVNPLLVIGTLVLLARLFGRLGSPSPLLSALSLVTIPFIWTVTGMALTELPALFFLSASLLALVHLHHTTTPSRALIPAVIGGLLFGVATLGRQPLLVVLFSIPLLAYYQRSHLIPYLVFLFSALIFPAVVFFVWQGLVPPKTAYTGEGFSPFNAMSSFMYGGIVMLILAPRWFVMKRWMAVTIVALSISFSHLFPVGEVTPLRPFVERYLPSSLVPYYSKSIVAAFVSIAMLFIIATVLRLREKRGDGLFIAFTLASCACLAANGKVTHLFTSRYLVTTLPLMLIVAEPYVVHDRYKAVRGMLGGLVGLASLYSYYRAD